MKMLCLRLILVSVIVCTTSLLQSAAHPDAKEKKATNLKVLPKNISEDELHAIMRMYSKSLGVRCKHCHAQSKTDPKKLDFASDEKREKTIARGMIKMTERINKKYLGGHNGMKLDQISCVTCHRGAVHPITSIDSLPAAH